MPSTFLAGLDSFQIRRRGNLLKYDRITNDEQRGADVRQITFSIRLSGDIDTITIFGLVKALSRFSFKDGVVSASVPEGSDCRTFASAQSNLEVSRSNSYTSPGPPTRSLSREIRPSWFDEMRGLAHWRGICV